MRHLRSLVALSVLWLLPLGTAASDPGPVIRVGIVSGQRVTACSATSRGPLTIEDQRGSSLANLPPGTLLRAEAKDGLVSLSCQAPLSAAPQTRYAISSPSPVEVCPEGGKARAYRGSVAIQAAADRLCLTNDVDLEDYLRGVLPAEIPASFAPEALRAQAIAARTFALVSAGRHAAQGYELCDSYHCQVYLGVTDEDPRTDAAIRDTAGLIVTYQGQPIHAVYHDSCGGRTAANETAWSASKPLPYLRPVSDTEGGKALCGDSPNAAWTRQVPQAKLAAALARFSVTAPIAAVEPATRDENGRPRDFSVRGNQGEVTIAAGALREAVNHCLGPTALPSADFTAAPNGDAIVFAGRGSGHGVGLCQWGANAMAREGRTAAEILSHYYTGTAIAPITAEIAGRLARPGTG